MTAALAPAHEAVEQEGVTYLYDQPRHSVYVKGFAVGRFLAVLVGFQAITALMFADAMAFDKALWMMPLFFLAGFFVAFRFARLRVFGGSWGSVAGSTLGGYFGLGSTILMLQWLAHALDGVFLLGFLMRWAYYLGGLGLVGMLFFSSARSLAEGSRSETKAVPRVIVPTAKLHERRARMQADQNRLLSPVVFDAEDGPLVAAWGKKNTDTIERLLREGEALNRAAHQEAIAMFNTARGDIDLARGRLRHLVLETELALVPYAIDYDRITIDRSGVLEGSVAHASLPPKDVMQTLNYSGGVSSAITKAATGSAPWQVAAVMVVFSGVMMAVNHQKLLRQLKELEGQVKAQAAAVRGDYRLIGDLFFQQLVPQFDALLGLIGRLEDELQGLHDAEALAASVTETMQDKAFTLACTFREARYYLEMKAGN